MREFQPSFATNIVKELLKKLDEVHSILFNHLLLCGIVGIVRLFKDANFIEKEKIKESLVYYSTVVTIMKYF